MLLKNKLRPFVQNISKWNIKNTFNVASYKLAICSCGFSFLNKNQLESCRKIISRFLKLFYKIPKFRISINFKTALTKKSLGARMGRGKGSVYNYVYKLRKNDILFEFTSITTTLLKLLIRKLKYKLPVKLKIVTRYKNDYCRNEDRLFR